MDVSMVCKTSLDLKSYLLNPASSKKRHETSLSSSCQDAYSVPISDAAYGKCNLDFDDDPLFLDYTANVIAPRFAKRRRLTLIKLYSSESANFVDKYGCSTASMLDQYLEKINHIVRKTNSARSVREQLSPVCVMDLKGIKPLSCINVSAEHCLSVWDEKRNNFFSEYASRSSGEEGNAQSTNCFSKDGLRESTPVPPPRRKRMITKYSENKTKGQKRKNEGGQDLFEARESSYPIPPPRKKVRQGDPNKASKDGGHHFTTTDGTIFSKSPNDDRCSIERYETPIKENCTGINTTYVNCVNVCERLQRERSSVFGTKLPLNSNSLQHYQSRQNVGTKRPVMGKSAIFVSIDSLSFDILTEINRKVHLKYGDRKRRRVKTNGILKSASGAKTTIRETSEVFRNAGPCKKLIAIRKKMMFMKKDCSKRSIHVKHIID